MHFLYIALPLLALSLFGFAMFTIRSAQKDKQ